MTKIFSCKWIFTMLLAAAMAFMLTGCDQNVDEGESSQTNVKTTDDTTEEINGDYDFTGTTWTYTSSSGSTTYSFTNNAVTMTDVFSTTTTTKEYSYTQDKTNALLKLKLTKVTETENDSTFSYTSATEQEAHYTSTGTSYGSASTYACTAAEFAEEKVFRYSVSGTTLKLTDYFNAKLPTIIHFDSAMIDGAVDGQATNHYSNYTFMFVGGTTGSTFYEFCPTFSGNTFTGNMFTLSTSDIVDKDTADSETQETSFGTVEGTYTASGSGSKSCYITVKFTTLPSGVTGISTNTEYKLGMYDVETSYEYTKQQ